MQTPSSDSIHLLTRWKTRLIATTAHSEAQQREISKRSRITYLLSFTAVSMLAISGCATIPHFPPEVPANYVPAPQLTEVDSAHQGNLSAYGFSEAQRMAVRVRNVGCSSVTRGTGFAVNERTLITNRHVVEGTTKLQLSTYDGRDVDVTNSSVASIADLALVHTEEDLDAYPILADADPEPGDALTVVGYPGGGVLTVTSGVALAYKQDPLNENVGKVLVSDAEVEPGSSGSAVLDTEGRLVGVVYAKSNTGHSYIIPVSSLLGILNDNSGFDEQQTMTCSR